MKPYGPSRSSLYRKYARKSHQICIPKQGRRSVKKTERQHTNLYIRSYENV